MILGFRLDFTLHTNISPHLASPVGEGQVTLTMSSAYQISPLSFSPVGEMKVTSAYITDDSQTAKGRQSDSQGYLYLPYGGG